MSTCGESCLEQVVVPVCGALSSLSQNAGALGVLTCCFFLGEGDFSVLWEMSIENRFFFDCIRKERRGCSQASLGACSHLG